VRSFKQLPIASLLLCSSAAPELLQERLPDGEWGLGREVVLFSRECAMVSRSVKASGREKC
jgi:hypothetical protein